jgi:CheY-like chemotaxis protein
MPDRRFESVRDILAFAVRREIEAARGYGRLAAQAETPGLRDLLLDHGIMADTLETATTWGHYLDLYRAVQEAMATALGERGHVGAHLSHSYSDGGSIYYTFLAPQERGNELGQWQRVKSAATQAIVEHGGALSHHHGIGSDHRPWMAAYLGAGGVRALAALTAGRMDAVILDIVLGEESGIDILKKLLAADKTVSVIMITAYASVEAAVQSLKLGAFDYVKKPLDFDELLKTVEKACETNVTAEQ